jgi:hypothetical protein
MTDRIRSMADETLAMHKEFADFGIEQAKLAKKGTDSMYDTARASMELARDSQQKMVQMWVDAVAPKKDQANA